VGVVLGAAIGPELLDSFDERRYHWGVKFRLVNYVVHGALAAGLLLRGPSVASAQTAAAPVAPSQTAEAPAVVVADGDVQKPTVRNGLILGASFGIGLASAAGYPNDVLFDKNPDFYASTPALFGYGVNFMAMGALTSYVNVGVFGGYAAFENSNWKSVGGGGGLRIEAYPLIAVCPCVIPAKITNHLGVYGQFGIGAVSTDVKRPGRYETVGGVESILSGGAFYEFWLGKLFSAGPDMRYEVITSRTSDRNSFLLGLRFAFYPGNSDSVIP
jgi:hypothetical protein